jgi:hypothetical protein
MLPCRSGCRAQRAFVSIPACCSSRIVALISVSLHRHANQFAGLETLLALVFPGFVPGLLTVPGIIVAINGDVIVIYVKGPRSTQCLPLLTALMVLTPNISWWHFLIILYLMWHLTISSVITTHPQFCVACSPQSSWPYCKPRQLCCHACVSHTWPMRCWPSGGPCGRPPARLWAGTKLACLLCLSRLSCELVVGLLVSLPFGRKVGLLVVPRPS